MKEPNNFDETVSKKKKIRKFKYGINLIINNKPPKKYNNTINITMKRKKTK
jgi:hypothetical protein